MPPNRSNKTLFVGDNLHVLRGINDETVDLIYVDLPYNSNRTYAAPSAARPPPRRSRMPGRDLLEHEAEFIWYYPSRKHLHTYPTKDGPHTSSTRRGGLNDSLPTQASAA